MVRQLRVDVVAADLVESHGAARTGVGVELLCSCFGVHAPAFDYICGTCCGGSGGCFGVGCSCVVLP